MSLMLSACAGCNMIASLSPNAFQVFQISIRDLQYKVKYLELGNAHFCDPVFHNSSFRK